MRVDSDPTQTTAPAKTVRSSRSLRAIRCTAERTMLRGNREQPSASRASTLGVDVHGLLPVDRRSHAGHRERNVAGSAHGPPAHVVHQGVPALVARLALDDERLSRWPCRVVGTMQQLLGNFARNRTLRARERQPRGARRRLQQSAARQTHVPSRERRCRVSAGRTTPRRPRPVHDEPLARIGAPQDGTTLHASMRRHQSRQRPVAPPVGALARGEGLVDGAVLQPVPEFVRPKPSLEHPAPPGTCHEDSVVQPHATARPAPSPELLEARSQAAQPGHRPKRHIGDRLVHPQVQPK